ncbi:MAG TPA: hypothetical protein VIL74_06500 [Pyrinomonadaceae bacterium]
MIVHFEFGINFFLKRRTGVAGTRRTNRTRKFTTLQQLRRHEENAAE